MGRINLKNLYLIVWLVILPIAIKELQKQIIENLIYKMTPLPQLVKATSQGGTIHKYQLSGGKTSFMRYLGCYLGTCKFCNDIDEASEFVSSIELSPTPL